MYLIFILLIILLLSTIYGTYIKPVKFVRNINVKNKAKVKNNDYNSKIKNEEKK